MTQQHDTSNTQKTPPPKRYEQPAIVHELALETRAGSPLGIPNPLDPAGLAPDGDN